MKCEKIQEIILTDYLDECVDSEMKNVVEDHLKFCAGCNEFLSLAKNATTEPFDKAERVELSEDFIWSRIQNSIQSEKELLEEPPIHLSFLERCKRIFSFPQPALVYGSLFAAALFFIVLGRGTYSVQQNTYVVEITEEAEYVAYVFADSSSDENYFESESSQTEFNAYYL